MLSDGHDPEALSASDAFDRAFNAVLAFLMRMGVSVYGSRVLAVRGLKSCAWRTVPVNLLVHEGERYLVAPRGETEWVRNIRAARGGELRLGSRREPIAIIETRRCGEAADSPGVRPEVVVRGSAVL